VLAVNELLCRCIHTSNGIIKSLFGQLAGLVRRVQNLIIENREVQGQTQTDWVSGRKAGCSDVSGSLVGLKRLVSGGLALVTNGKLGKVTMVVTLPITVLVNGVSNGWFKKTHIL